jgi:hypothetical protein
MTNADITITAPTTDAMVEVVVTQQEVSTTVESNLDEQKVRDELTAIRDLVKRNGEVDAEGRSELNKSTQKRLRDFLQRGWKQARELIKPENKALLTALLKEVNLDLAASKPKVLEQIAFAQMCYRIEKGKEKGSWTVASRRHERTGRIYRVFDKQGWSADGLAKKLADYKGGISKLLSDNVFVDPREEAKKAKRRARVLKDRDAVAVDAAYDEKLEGTWTLALVSYDGGQVRYHRPLDAKPSEVEKYLDGYTAKRSNELLEQAEDRELDAEQAA